MVEQVIHGMDGPYSSHESENHYQKNYNNNQTDHEDNRSAWDQQLERKQDDNQEKRFVQQSLGLSKQFQCSFDKYLNQNKS